MTAAGWVEKAWVAHVETCPQAADIRARRGPSRDNNHPDLSFNASRESEM